MTGAWTGGATLGPSAVSSPLAGSPSVAVRIASHSHRSRSREPVGRRSQAACIIATIRRSDAVGLVRSLSVSGSLPVAVAPHDVSRQPAAVTRTRTHSTSVAATATTVCCCGAPVCCCAPAPHPIARHPAGEYRAELHRSAQGNTTDNPRK